MWQAILGTARPNFLLLAPLCVSVAIAYAHFLAVPISTLDVVLCYIAGVISHASVNMLNEYYDHVSGLDSMTERTPFNGGSGTLQRFPEHAKSVKRAGWVLLAISVNIGLYFVVKQGYVLLVIGLLATASVLFYTPQINRLPFVCLIAPGFGFGVAFVVGSFVALTGWLNTGIVLLAIPVFLLTNNLLLLNQFPDRAADKKSGRRHFIIQYGESAGKWVYLLALVLVVVCTLFVVNRFAFALAGMALVLPLLAGAASFYGLAQYLKSKHLAQFTPFLACNVVATLSYPAILSGLLMWGG